MSNHIFTYDQPFHLETGGVLPSVDVFYTTYGKLNEKKDNVIWICHALTANSKVDDWWPGYVEEGALFDTSKYFIVCANVIGSCYGSTGPHSVNPETGQQYFRSFPTVTIKDMIKAFDLLRKDLGISNIHLLVGGSLGGQQAVEWAIEYPHVINNLILIATNAIHSPWAIALNESQRMAIYADPTWKDDSEDAGQAGLSAARTIALLSYRNYKTYDITQKDEDDKYEGFKAVTYQQYQGKKIINRFNVHAYLALTKALDAHNVGRNRGGCEKALKRITAKSLVIGISSDLLFPPNEQEYLAEHIPGSELVLIDSTYGHDGFLIESALMKKLIGGFIEKI